MNYIIMRALPRVLLAAIAVAFIVCGHPWVALFPLAALVLGLGCPRIY